MMAWVMPKHVFKKLYRELEIFVNSIINIIIVSSSFKCTCILNFIDSCFFKVAGHSFQVPTCMPIKNSPLLLNYYFMLWHLFSARAKQLTTKVFILALWPGCMLLPWPQVNRLPGPRFKASTLPLAGFLSRYSQEQILSHAL